MVSGLDTSKLDCSIKALTAGISSPLFSFVASTFPFTGRSLVGGIVTVSLIFVALSEASGNSYS